MVLPKKNEVCPKRVFARSSTDVAKFKIPERIIVSMRPCRAWERASRPSRPQGPVRHLKIGRRTLLVGGGVGVGLIVGFSLWPWHMGSDLAIERGEQAFGSFIKVAKSGQVTVAVPQAETGQGIWTALSQVVADELGAAWTAVAVEPAPLTGLTQIRWRKPKGGRRAAELLRARPR